MKVQQFYKGTRCCANYSPNMPAAKLNIYLHEISKQPQTLSGSTVEDFT